MALYAAFAWFGQSRSALIGFSLAIGVLIGAEVPLLMTLIQRVRRQDAGGAVADLFAADYVGALVGGLAFPFLLLPCLGQLTGALVTGGVNAVAGGALVLWLFRRDLTRRARWALLAANVLVLALLVAGAVLATPFERAARKAVYGSAARVAVQTGVQEVVMTGGTGAGARAGRGRKGSGRPLALYLDGRLRVSADTEFRYHEALVHPAMAGGPHGRVLVLGGGDGLAVREILRYRSVRSVTVVELDPGLMRLARTDPGLSALNRHSLSDPRVRTVTADAFSWLREHGGARAAGRRRGTTSSSPICPTPGSPRAPSSTRRSSTGSRCGCWRPTGGWWCTPGRRSPGGRSFWTVEATLRSVGLRTAPYRFPGRFTDFSGGPDRAVGLIGPLAPEASTAGGTLAAPATGPIQHWGFLLAARQPLRPDVAPDAPPLATVTPSHPPRRRAPGRPRPHHRPAAVDADAPALPAVRPEPPVGGARGAGRVAPAGREESCAGAGTCPGALGRLPCHGA